MPIKPIVLQRRHAELGRIRLGAKTTYSNGKEGPKKLGAFRFTSPSKTYLEDLATLYGGDVLDWDNNGKAEFEVFTTATSIPVIAVKGGLSQWMETWSGGGCIHRCDGETNVLTNEPCDLNEKVKVGNKTVNPHTEARPTTRLSVMLPELEAIGVWRMESHGWNAAAEIPAVAELAQYVGDLVPAVLHLVERRSVKDGQTSRFVVPVLDLKIGTARLREIVAEVSGGTAEITTGDDTKQIEAGTSADSDEPRLPTLEDVKRTDNPEALRSMWRFLASHDALGDDLKAAIEKRVNELKGDTGDVVEGEIVDDDAEAVWERIVKVGGQLGMTLSQLQSAFAEANGGLSASTASAGELQVFLTALEGELGTEKQAS